MFPSLRPRRRSTFTVISDETLLSEEYCRISDETQLSEEYRRNMPRMFFCGEITQLSSHDDYLSNIDVADGSLEELDVQYSALRLLLRRGRRAVMPGPSLFAVRQKIQRSLAAKFHVRVTSIPTCLQKMRGCTLRASS